MNKILNRLKYYGATRILWPLSVKKRVSGKRSSPSGKPPFGPPLQITRKLREIMGFHYFEGRFSEGVKPVAWVTSGAPIEILRALDFFIFYPENHAAMCCVQRLVPELSAVVEEKGFSMDLCSYARCDMGSAISGKTPVGKVPKPDILIACTNICQTVLYWYRSLSEMLGVPLVVIDTPFVYGDVPQHHLKYVKAQLERVADIAEDISGRTLELDRFSHVLRLSADASLLWGEALAASKHRPAPWTAFDQFVHMAPIVSLRGTYECYAYYAELVDELRDRIYQGISAVQTEKYRLLWDNLPVWFKLRDFSTILAEEGFNIVISTYTNAWYQSTAYLNSDEADPFEALTEAYIHIILNMDLNHKLELMENLMKDYSCDGVILHSDKSCKPYSIGQYDLKEKLLEKGFKAFVLEADHGDPRFYTDEQVKNRLQAFFEMFSY